MAGARASRSHNQAAHMSGCLDLRTRPQGSTAVTAITAARGAAGRLSLLCLNPRGQKGAESANARWVRAGTFKLNTRSKFGNEMSASNQTWARASRSGRSRSRSAECGYVSRANCGKVQLRVEGGVQTEVQATRSGRSPSRSATLGYISEATLWESPTDGSRGGGGRTDECAQSWNEGSPRLGGNRRPRGRICGNIGAAGTKGRDEFGGRSEVGRARPGQLRISPFGSAATTGACAVLCLSQGPKSNAGWEAHLCP